MRANCGQLERKTMTTKKHIAFGTKHHQQILKTIQNFYSEDKRITQILVFGSLGRGNWDEYSDIDLDIILIDGVVANARNELIRLCTKIQNEHGLGALIIADAEEGDVVLSNLVEFSVRYHALNDTKPAILESMQTLSGSLSLEEIRASANYDYDPIQKDAADIVNEYIRYTLGLHHAIMRQRVWMATEMLHRARNLLVLMYAVTNNASRPTHFFDKHAGSELRQLLTTLTVPAELKFMKRAFCNAISLLENHIDVFSNGVYQLTSTQIVMVEQLKQLQMYEECPYSESSDASIT